MAQGLVYSQRSRGGKLFAGRLRNVSDPDMPTDIPLNNVATFQVYFRQPDGTVIVRTALVDPDATNPNDNMDIYYITTPDDPVIDAQTGYWEYTVGLTRNTGTVIVSPTWEGFWVIE